MQDDPCLFSMITPLCRVFVCGSFGWQLGDEMYITWSRLCCFHYSSRLRVFFTRTSANKQASACWPVSWRVSEAAVSHGVSCTCAAVHVQTRSKS